MYLGLVCGLMCTSVTMKGGVVQSPKYPLDYGNDRNCTVTITVPAKRKIQLKFAAFNLERDDMNVYDTVTVSVSNSIFVLIIFKGIYILGAVFCFSKVYDGSMSVFLLNEMSGNRTPPVVTTKTNKMMINFISDESNITPSTANYNWQAAFTSVTV